MSHNFQFIFIFILINLILKIDCRSLIIGNYKEFCDETYQDSSAVLRGYQALISNSSNQNLDTRYLLIKNVNNFNDCVKQCCLNECDVAFFNHSSNACLHLICNLSNNSTHLNQSTIQCPLVRKDSQQLTSILQIRSPTARAKIDKYQNELSKEQLIKQFGFLDEDNELNKNQLNFILKSKHFNESNSQQQQLNQSKFNKLTVILNNKNPILQLPNDSITIKAFVYPINNQYIYKWTLISKPQQDSGSSEEQNNDSLKLNKLIAGNYIFNLTVSTPTNLANGQASVNISVLSPKRLNKSPIAIIQPNNLTVQLPKKEIVLDGSQSVDDDRIVNFEWQLVKAPIGFELDSNDLKTSTLQIKSLIAGSYIVQLTVTDSDNETSSTQSNLNVIKEVDYPPTAIVSQDQILFLPQNEVTLIGNASTDDKKIVSYEWMLEDENDSNKQMNNMDISGVKTPFLHLSNLKIGIYKFILKVTDSSNQTSQAETHVFVKPEIDIKPEANAGQNQKYYMPFKRNVTLNGSKSKDVIGIVKFNWTQTNGPRLTNILNANESITNVTGLVQGVYKFLLIVSNAKNLTSNDSTEIEIVQISNQSPVANAGDNQTIECDIPCNIVTLNGSRSNDDLIDLKFSWQREPNSLAAGEILDKSYSSPILKLSNLIKGRYIWKLTVEDTQKAQGSDIVYIDIKEPANAKDFVEILLNVNYKSFKYKQQNAIVKKLESILSSNIDESIKLSNVRLYPIYNTELVQLRFIVQMVVNDKSPINLTAIEAVKRLRLRLRNDKLINPEILSIRTAICQNECSGHGKCDQLTKQCVCQAFWMENFLRVYFGDSLENCDFSIIYVLIFSFFAILFTAIILWNFLSFFMRRPMHLKLIKPRFERFRRIDLLKKTRKARSMKYTLLKQTNGFNKINNQTSDEDLDGEQRNKQQKKTNGSIETKFKIKNVNSNQHFKDSSSDSEEEVIQFDAISRRGYS